MTPTQSNEERLKPNTRIKTNCPWANIVHGLEGAVIQKDLHNYFVVKLDNYAVSFLFHASELEELLQTTHEDLLCEQCCEPMMTVHTFRRRKFCSEDCRQRWDDFDE